jgi:UDP-glucuronate 4-epimerase
MKTILVTGAAGFIGSHVAQTLLATGHSVIGLDNMNDYYDVRLKQYRLDQLLPHGSFHFVRADIQDTRVMDALFTESRIDAIVHLAAMAGVRYSEERPDEYVSTNIGGTLNVLRLAERHGVRNIVFASSSSVYSGCPTPFHEESPSDAPISTYGATKKSGELLMHVFHSLYGINVVVLRYFTVYGPQGRPDMSYFKFIRSIEEGRPLDIYGDGTQTRDFTFVEDAARATMNALSLDGYHILNVAGGKEPVTVNELINSVADLLGKKAMIRYDQRLKTDLEKTQADISKARTLLPWEPRVDFRTGIRTTVEWHLNNKEFVRTLKH